MFVEEAGAKRARDHVGRVDDDHADHEAVHADGRGAAPKQDDIARGRLDPRDAVVRRLRWCLDWH